jgi:hypothetical protein
MTPSTIATTSVPRAKNSATLLPMLAGLRLEAAAVMRSVFPDRLKRYTLPLLPASTLSKARHGYRCNPLYRFDLCLVGLWKGGAPRERALLLVEHAQDVVDRFWAAEVPDARQLSLLESEWEGRANPLQMAFQGGVEDVRGDLVATLRAHRSALSTLILSLIPGLNNDRRSA